MDGKQAKGIDDALLTNTPISVGLHHGRGMVALDAETMDELQARLTPAQMYSVDEARAGNYDTIAGQLASYDGAAATGRVLALTSTTGTGKTYAARAALADLWRVGWPTVQRRRHSRKLAEDYTEYGQLRVAVLVDRREQVLEWQQELAKRGVPTVPLIGRVAIYDDPTPEQDEEMRRYQFALCAKAAEANAYAQRNHSTAYVCGPMSEPHDCAYSEMLTRAGVTPSGEQGDDTGAACVVVATKDALLNVDDRIDRFDLIICDETIDDKLYEEASIDAEGRKAWRRGIERSSDVYPEGCPQRRMLDLLALAVERNEGQQELIAALRDRALDAGIDLARLLADCQAEKPSRRDCLALEAPLQWVDGGETKDVIPPRYWQIMIADLVEQGDRAPRWWINDGQLIFTSERAHLLRRLSPGGAGRCDAIILDATPGPIMGSLLPHAEQISYPVREHIAITQVSDALYTSSGLATRKAAAAHRLADVGAALANCASQSATIGHKRFMKPGGVIAARLDEISGAQVGWYGKDDKAHNDWQDANRLIIVGHYQLPPGVCQRTAAMLRRASGEQAGEQAGEAGRVLRPYLYRDEHGNGRAWWAYVGGDALADALAYHSEQAAIRQAIGRLRAALGSPATPTEVYLLTATSVADLHIDRLITLDQLVAEIRAGGDVPPVEARRAAHKLKALNSQRSEEAAAKLAAAWAEGVRGLRALARATSVSFPTIQKWLASQANERGKVFNGVIDTVTNIYITTMSKTPLNAPISTRATILYQTWAAPPPDVGTWPPPQSYPAAPAAMQK